MQRRTRHSWQYSRAHQSCMNGEFFGVHVHKPLFSLNVHSAIVLKLLAERLTFHPSNWAAEIPNCKSNFPWLQADTESTPRSYPCFARILDIFVNKFVFAHYSYFLETEQALNLKSWSPVQGAWGIFFFLLSTKDEIGARLKIRRAFRESPVIG
jgi:hypothetical protein